MVQRLILLIVGVGLLGYTIAPDPFPIVVDDIVAALTGAAALLKVIKSFIEDLNKDKKE